MTPVLEAKLLRVLQEGWLERGGGTKTHPTDAGIIAAATPELDRLIAEGKFRRDLFSRLNVYAIHLPPLRERWHTLCDEGTRAVSTYNKTLDRWNTTITAPSFFADGPRQQDVIAITEATAVGRTVALFAEEPSLHAPTRRALHAIRRQVAFQLDGAGALI